MVIALVALSCLYLVTQLFKTLLVLIGAASHKQNEKLKIPKNLPIYSILLPLHHEDGILKDLIHAINEIDYPDHLLDVKLLIEESDQKTLQAAYNIKMPKYVEIIEVPSKQPFTKPKACNYGLQFVKGKYVTIYDAEDCPDQLQLKQVVAKFSTSSTRVVCIQAKLNFYNREENILTKLFALEYALQFDFILIGLKKLGMPIPLGGTSNHFIRAKLEELGGWDAFNVTEDADLGMRIYQKGYCTELVDSITLEEAPIDLRSWLIQRSRWIKGNLLTGFMHMQKHNKLSLKEKLGLCQVLLLLNISYALLPVYLALIYFNMDNQLLNLLWKVNLYLGVVLPISFSLLIICSKKWYNFKLVVLSVPIYYVFLSIASIRAVLEIFKRPFYWDKTHHGITKLSKQ